MLSKKGYQGPAAGAAVLILLIAGALVTFIVLLQPADRAELLGETIGSSQNSSFDNARGVEVLLRETPGRIDYLAQREIEHPLPVINIETSKEAKILARKNVVATKNALFTEENSQFKFSAPNLDLSENFLLSFNVKKLEGDLIVVLNEEQIFAGSLSEGAIPPIQIPATLIAEENTITFISSSVGMGFWKTHESLLENVQIVATVQNIESQSSKNIFLVSETERENLDKVILRFQPECIIDQVGPLTISVNGREIYRAVPDCGLSMVPIEFSPELVNQGENDITFSTQRGRYLLTHVLVESRLKDIDFPTFYFELDRDQYEAVYDDFKRVRVHIDFVDVITRKRADVVVNGRINSIDTKEVEYTFDISDDIVLGNNALKVKPRHTLEVREIEVALLD